MLGEAAARMLGRLLIGVEYAKAVAVTNFFLIVTARAHALWGLRRKITRERARGAGGDLARRTMRVRLAP